MTDSSTNRRNIGLDVLRSLAIILVLIEHGSNLFIGYELSILKFIGIDGVTVFFVLSGFLIGRIILRLCESNLTWNSLLRFLQRRWLRTLPNYFLILFLLVITSSIRSESYSFIEISKYLVFAQNIFSPHPSFFPEAWSLSIEEWFYLIFPICLFLIFSVINYTRQRLFWFIIICILGIIIFRYGYFLYLSEMAITSDIWDESIRKIVVTRFDAPLYGVLLAIISQSHASQNTSWFRIQGIFGLVLFFFHISIYTYCSVYEIWIYASTFSFTIFSIAIACFIPWFISLEIPNKLLSTIFTNTSKWSYSLYLVNLTLVQVTLIAHLPLHWFIEEGILVYFIRYLLFWIVSFGISYFLYQYFEKPILKCRNRMFPEL